MNKKITPMSKAELARKYGFSTATLRRRMRRAGIEISANHILTADQIANIVLKCGHYEADDPVL